MNFNELYPKEKEYYYLLMDIKTTAECNVSNCIIDKQKAKLLMRYINKKEKEKENLNNIINELEKHCETMLSIFEQMTDEQRQEQLDKYKIYDGFLRRIQELKGDDK